MIELERVDCSSLTEGADVTPLADITEKPSIGFVSDIPGERAFFLKEEFATFNCLETFSEDSCEFRLISQIPWMDHYAWALFNSHNLTMDRGDVARKQQGKYAFVSQALSFTLSKDADFGYFQMICLPEQVIHDGSLYRKFDLINFMVYRNLKAKRAMPLQPLITLNPRTDQTYVPMIPGQHLQIIVSDEENIEVNNDDCFELLPGSSKLFTLGRNGKPDRMRAATYVCRAQGDDCLIYVGNKVIILPKVKVEAGKAYINILKPVGEAVIYTEGIDGVEIACPSKESWAWDEKAMEMFATDDGVSIRLPGAVNSLCLQRDNDIWWVLASNLVGTI